MAMDTQAGLDNSALENVANELGEDWQKISTYLSFDDEERRAIRAKFPNQVNQQAKQMLMTWRDRYQGADMLGDLKQVLRDGPLEELITSPRLPSCSCRNKNVLKFKCIISAEDEHDLMGIRCTKCGQEWLREKFLYQKDLDGTRPKIQLRGGVDLKKQLEVPREHNLAFQVKESRTEISYPHYADDYFKIGDHITWHRPWGVWHHAVVSGIDEKGRVKIIHWTKSHCGSLCIQETWTDLKKENGQLFRIDYREEISQVNPPELVIARARSRLGDTGYGVSTDNCESFAAYCKSGVAESNQVMWFYEKCKGCIYNTLTGFGGIMAESGVIAAQEFFKEGTKGVCEVFGAEVLERIGHGTDTLGAFFIFGFEGATCVFDLIKYYNNRKNGNMSLKDFLETACRRVFEALCAAGLAAVTGIAGGVAGGATGGAVLGTFLFPNFGTAIGTLLGSILGGSAGLVIGRPIGSIVGSNIARFLTYLIIATDDRAVEAITDLKTGDHVVFYGNLLHPRHHAIVVDCNSDKNKVRVVHNTYSKGVVEEDVDFIHPVYRLVYEKDACYPPDEVIERARSKVGEYRYSLARYNCKSFARWCKQKKTCKRD